MLTMQIGWPIATRPAVEHGSGQKSSFSTCWTWPLSTVTSFYLHVVGRKSHTDFRLTLIREMLAQAGHEPRPSMPVGRPAQSSTNIGRLDTSHNKHWPGRSQTKRRCRVFSRGREAKCHIQMCEVWRGALYWPRVFQELSHKAQLIRHLFVRPPYKHLKPRPQCK